METNTKRRVSVTHSLATAANTPKPQPAPSVGALLTPQQLAEKLAVPASWIREKTRRRARVRDSDPLPVVRLGKYVRFRWAEVEAWLARQSV
jgi:predicted DNA-binding transcriptional regulator AlpA